jgi:hypothetical protein
MKTMKKNFISVRVPILTLSAAILLIAGSCKKDNNKGNTNEVIFKANLNGPSEAPPTSSAATGNATLTYNQTTKIFNIVTTYTGLTPTAGHIHKGDPGVAGPVVFPFNPPFTSPINYTSTPLDSIQIADLFAGRYYVNLHTAAFPNGEIRGQLVKQ